MIAPRTPARSISASPAADVPPGDMTNRRRLERETHRNLEVIWLMRRLRPDHKAIAEFRRKHPKALKQVSREFVLLCRKLDLFSAQLVFIDGAKFRAVNGKDRNFTVPKLQILLARIDANIGANSASTMTAVASEWSVTYVASSGESR